MPLTRIRQTAIGNDSITSAKLAHDLDLDGDFVRVPHGTTAQRPSSPVAGYMRFNTTLGTLEQWNTNTNSWAAIDSPPIISSLSYSGSLTAADPVGGETITLSGSNFKSGLTIDVGGTTASSVSFIDSTSATFTTPAKTAGDYDVKLTNPNGLSATLTNGISYNGLPAFTTAAGQVGSDLNPNDAMSTLTIVAAEPDGGTLAFSVTSGALPTGVSLGSANGQLTGTPAGAENTTTYNFTVTATDDENQTNNRAFNLVVIRPIWSKTISNSLINEKETNTYLHKTFGSAGNRKKWTFSAWLKLSNPPESGYFPRIFSAGTGAGSQTEIVITEDARLRYEDRTGNTLKANLDSNTRLNDTTNWHHIVVAVDIANATQSLRQKMYINGVEITSFNSPTEHTDTSYDSYVNAAAQHRIGESMTYGGNRFGGYLAEIYFIDGQALDPSSFGTQYNGTWTPKTYSGTYGTNGFFLEFQDASNLGDDTSGNTNDWTSVGHDPTDGNGQSVDTPGNNFPTMNRNDSQIYGNLREGGLWIYKGAARYLLAATAGAHVASGGKYYFEVTLKNIGSGGVALGHVPQGRTPNPDTEGDIQSAGGWRLRLSTTGSSIDISGASQQTWGTTWAVDDVAGIGLDIDAEEIKVYKNGSGLVATYDISSVINNEAYWLPCGGGESGGQTNGLLFNFGATAFTIGLPSGYRTYKEENNTLIMDAEHGDEPQKNFGTLTWSGAGTTSVDLSLTGLGFRPDFVWSKARTHAYHHALFDSVRGPSSHLATDRREGQNTVNGGRLGSFDADGFTWTPGGSTSQWFGQSGKNYVAWCWKAGGQPTATNTVIGGTPVSGSIMIDGVASTASLSGSLLVTQQSVNTKAGFSITQYTGNGAGSATVDHGLGRRPGFIIVKRRNATDDWIVDFDYTGNTSNIINSSNAFGSDSSWGTHTNTVMTLSGSTGARNTNNESHIMYAFAEIPGYSAIGRYRGTGDVGIAGSFVYTGFRPAFIIIKANSSGQFWVIHDSKRSGGRSYQNERLFPNSANASDNGGEVYFHASGFKIQNGAENLDNVDLSYFAIADQSAVYANSGLVNI